MKHLTAVASLCLAGSFYEPARAEPRITSLPTTYGYKVVIEKFEGSDQNVAQAMIGPVVSQLCAGKSPLRGRFELKPMLKAASGKTLKPGRFEQMIKCVDTTQPVEAVATPAFSATPDDDKAVEDTALAFLALRDKGDARGSFVMLAPSMQATTDRENWDREAGNRRAEADGNVERRIVKVTWYVDPPGVELGVYAAADFDGRSNKLAVHCGYIAVRRLNPTKWGVIRIEEGRLLAKDAKGFAAERITELRASLQCRN